MWWKKKEVVKTYYKKADAVLAWQFTKDNFTNGTPDFIKNDKEQRVSLWSQYGGNVISGTLTTANSKSAILENDWIVLCNEGFQVYDDFLFEVIFHTVKEKYKKQ